MKFVVFLVASTVVFGSSIAYSQSGSAETLGLEPVGVSMTVQSHLGRQVVRVTKKHGASASGAIGLWVDSGTAGYFTDLIITED